MNSINRIPEIQDVIYSIDRIRFISKSSIAEVKNRIPEKELLEHCIPDNDSIVNVHIDVTGREWGYITKVEASACDDKYIEIIKGCNPGTLSHLEIACDLIFDTMEEANAYMEWFEQNIERAYNRIRFKYETTLYLGTELGKKSNNYVRCYVRESKMVGKPCFHSEFVLEGATAIKKYLGIKSHNELPTSMECYHQLENTYLRIKDSGVVKGVKYGSVYVPKATINRIKGRLSGTRDISGN